MLKINQKTFEKNLSQSLKWKLVGARKKYFIKASMMPIESKEAYDGKFVELDQEAEEVDDVLGDIAATPSDELTAARLENIKARTAMLQEKLEAHKQELWSEWNAAFFECFTEAFAKFKNDLISLHLGEEQLGILTQKLESALKIMQDKLDAMWSDFNKEQEEEQGESK